RGVHSLWSQLPQANRSLEIGLVGVGVHRASAGETSLFGGKQRERQRAGDASREVVLQRQDARELALEAVGPALGLIANLDESCGDADSRSLPPCAPFEHVVDAEVAPDLIDRRRAVLVSHRRGA